MAVSSIEWTEMTWNPTTGCNKVSSGCKFCYAEVMAKRLQAMGIEKYKDGFKLALHEAALLVPYTWEWGHNIWMGVSVENQKVLSRIEMLQQTNARVKFLSCEPLIGPLPGMPLKGIDWPWN